MILLKRDHDHKYFFAESKMVFEPVKVPEGDEQLYRQVVYVIMSCGCGDAIKRYVKGDKSDDAIL
jgi:hypothetical protein